jgi:hypothetical protein
MNTSKNTVGSTDTIEWILESARMPNAGHRRRASDEVEQHDHYKQPKERPELAPWNLDARRSCCLRLADERRHFALLAEKVSRLFLTHTNALLQCAVARDHEQSD